MNAIIPLETTAWNDNVDPVARHNWGSELHPLIVIATKGRKHEVSRLIESLEGQTLQPTRAVVVGATPDDLPDLNGEWAIETVVSFVSSRPGASAQRNVGIAALLAAGFLIRPTHFVVFFDDDFIPSDDWLETASRALQNNPAWGGLTGRVLADGINGEQIELLEAKRILREELPPRPHWSNVPEVKRVASLYGCNMAVTTAVAANCRFDEHLPLYSWQEDCDYSGQARRIGSTVLFPECRGVHLGIKAGRVSGVKMGYSQIANPVRIALRGNMTTVRALRFVCRAISANLIKSLIRRQAVDYPGRMKGNALAIIDLLTLRLNPMKILTL